MKDYVSEIAVCPENSSEEIIVYSPKWYRKGEAYNDQYSLRIINSKTQDESSFFIPYIEKMADALMKEGKFKKVQLITAVPRSTGEESITIKKIGESLSKKLSSQFQPVFNKKLKERRNKKCSGSLERWKETKDDFFLKRRLLENEKSILILDDQKTSGSTFLACGRVLLKGGAKEIYYFCLGINRNVRLFGE